MSQPCDVMRDYAADLVSGLLGEDLAKDLERHVAECSDCRAYLEALRREDEALKRLFSPSRAQASEGLQTTVAALRRAMRGDDSTVSQDSKEPAIRLVPDVPTALADGVRRETHPIEQPPSRRRIWRFVAMFQRRTVRWSAVAAAIVIAVLAVTMLNRSATKAYAFEQTVAAIQGKRSLHVKVWLSGGYLKEEFWAEFDDQGKTLRFRQEEGSEVTVWGENVKFRYDREKGTLLKTKSNGQENVLERTDPELLTQRLMEAQTDAQATIEIRQPSAGETEITVIATLGPDVSKARFQDVLLVDPNTLFVNRIDHHMLRDGGWTLLNSVEVLEYNQPMDPAVFSLDLPDNVVVLDQVNQVVGMAQGDLSEEKLAAELVRQALEAWRDGDFARAGSLFGGMPADYLAQRMSAFRPVGEIVVGQAINKGKENWPRLEVPCRYEVRRGSQKEMIQRNLVVRGEPAWQKVNDEPGRFWVDIRQFIKDEKQSPPG